LEKKTEGESTKKAHAYTPGLKVKRNVKIRKTRRLPLLGEVFVKHGDLVDYNTIVAEVKMPGKPEIMKVAGLLNVESNEIGHYMLKKVGDSVKKDEIIAQCISLFGLIKKFAKSPIDGSIDSISEMTGRVTIRAPRESVNIDAYIPGEVVQVMPADGAVIETDAVFIQGIFGIGGENHGEIIMLAESNEDVLTAEKLKPVHKGKVLVAGALVDSEALKKAEEIGVSGIVSGGITERDLTSFIGHPIGVAITGEEDVGLTLVITEGFGKMTMSNRTYNLLKEFSNSMAHINGATQIRAGVLRPEIIIPYKIERREEEEEALNLGMQPGTPIRVIQSPYFGMGGTVVDLPVALQTVETEASVRVVVVKLDNGDTAAVPRANVEIIEE